MKKTRTRYEISPKSFIISDYGIAPKYWMIHDKDSSQWEEFGKAELEVYVQNVHRALIKHLLVTIDGKKYLSLNDEKQLMFMTESLLHAKRLLQEEEV